MANAEIETKKRGRPASVVDKRAAPKKEEKQLVTDGESTAKRGRGRPKGTTKKNGSLKKQARRAERPTSDRTRGRTSSTKKPDSTEEENGESDDSEGNDENGSVSD